MSAEDAFKAAYGKKKYTLVTTGTANGASKPASSLAQPWQVSRSSESIMMID